MMGSKKGGCTSPMESKKTGCDGCACSILNRADRGDQFYLLLAGTKEFLHLDSANLSLGTVFTFKYFNRETCCAHFTFDMQVPIGVQVPQPAAQDFIVDCRCICALSPIDVPR
ncbi:hypothetical protein [Cytobacillus sp. NCCP-133]|uniref:hypothetical protein n=1 Tax=Cytobacillus sp. NCCP-133 TaxID=766848 RepID=UPI00223282DF|nr:hypothetical protein [Cytobacillus sp. NCCP-133]GLB60126.1 hypothetical protein NCCP133_22580 [Cytobacillus sp. NCCP-133]